MQYKQKLSIEQKVEIVQEYLKGQISMNEAARRSGVRRQSFDGWVRNYEADGVDAFLPHKNRIYSLELKKAAVEEYLSSIGSLSEICKKISYSEFHTAQELDSDV